MSSMRYLLAIALPFFMLGLLPNHAGPRRHSLRRATQSTQQPGTFVEIHGRVLYPNGEVARAAIVFAFKEGRLTSRVPSGNSDDQGRFVIKRLESGVKYELCSSKQEQGYLLPYGLPFGLSTGGRCKNVTAGTESEIDIVLAPKGGTIEGEVRDARNRSAISNGKVIVYRPLKLVRGTWVLVNPRAATWVPSVEAPIGGNGQFEISGLPTGTYFLKVEIQGRKAWYFRNQVSDTAAQPIVIQAGLTRKIVVSIP